VNERKRILLLGSLTFSAVGACTAFEYFVFALPKQRAEAARVLAASQAATVSAPATRSQSEQRSSSSFPDLPSLPVESSASVVEAIEPVAPAMSPATVTTTENRLLHVEESLPQTILAAVESPLLHAEEEPPFGPVQPLLTFPLAKRSSYPLAPNQAEPEQGPELLIKAKTGYGGKFVSVEQKGDFGGVKGMVVPMNALSVEASMKFGEWRASAGLERFSADFAGDTANPISREEKQFRALFLKPAYGIFHLGVQAKTAPVLRTSGTRLEWHDMTALYGVAGLKLEKLYATRRRKPFLLGLDFEGAYPLSVSGTGGASFSSPSGFGLSLRGYGEKTIQSSDAARLSIGLEGSAAYDQIKWNGAIGGLSGSGSLTIQEYGSRLYLGIEF